MIGSYNEADNTIEVIFSTGERGLRGYWTQYYEELEISTTAMRMERLRKGGPFLKDHVNSIENQIGVVVDVWIEGKNAMARIRLSENPDHASVIADIRAGVIKNISVGYRVFKYLEVAVGEDEIPVYRAVDWEPMEISAVAVPFDSDSQTRSGELNNFECEFISNRTGEKKMTEEEKKAFEAEQKRKADEAAKAALEAERTRASEITKSAETAGLPVSFAQDLISRGVTLEESRGLMLSEMAKRQTSGVKTTSVEVVNDERDKVRSGMAEAILHRAGAKGSQLTDNGRRFRGMTLLDMARHFAKAGFQESRDEIIARAFHTTSDFPLILLDAVNKSLAFEYESAPQTFEQLVRRVPLSDFKMKHTIKHGSFPKLKKIGENGEIKAGTMSEGSESYKADSYASKILINRQTIINDDLDVFGKLPRLAAQSGRDLESDLVYALITSNPTMKDGNKLFSAAHKNIIAAGDIDVTNVGKAYALMRKQKGLDGKNLNLLPNHLLTPVALEGLALAFLAEKMVASKIADVNPYSSKLKGNIADSRLDDASETKWYLTASKDNADIIELGTLDGEGPKTNIKEHFATGIEFEVLHDVGVGLIDHVGLVGVGTFA
jgi:hypothetical protein